MTRNIFLLLLLTVFSVGGCKKKPAAGEATTGNPTTEATSAAAKTPEGEAAVPSAPDFSAQPPSATAATTAATPKPKAPAKPGVDSNASVVAFCYHNIENSPKAKNLTISVEQFEKEMQAIKDAGYTVIGMQDFLAWRRGDKNIPAKSALITIDDGWVSGYTNAWPILKKFEYPFTLFIYVKYVGSGGKSLSWAQLEEMRDAGVDIQSHTYHHANLKSPFTLVDQTTLAQIRKDVAELGHDGWMRKEIIDSKKVLEQQLGIRVNAIAYPFGNWNEQARAIVKEAGYEAAFTVYGQRLNRSSPYDLLGRYAVDAKQPKIFTDGLAMIGGGGGTASAEPLPSTVGQMAASSMVTQPLNGETITNATPTIKANLSTMGEVEPDSVEVRLSGVGALKPQYNAETKMMQVTSPQKLPAGNYSVIVAARVNGERREVRWGFNVGQTAGSLLSATPAPAPASGAETAAPPAEATPAATPAKGKARKK